MCSRDACQESQEGNDEQGVVDNKKPYWKLGVFLSVLGMDAISSLVLLTRLVPQ